MFTYTKYKQKMRHSREARKQYLICREVEKIINNSDLKAKPPLLQILYGRLLSGHAFDNQRGIKCLL